MAQRGIENNNWLNIRHDSANDWLGQVGADADNYAQYENPLYGLRAADTVLANYKSLHGIDTLEAAITRFAPSSDNNPTSNYIKFVSDKLGIDPTASIDLDDPDVRGALIEAMVAFETPEASSQFSPAVLEQARTLSAPGKVEPESSAVADFLNPSVAATTATASADPYHVMPATAPGGIMEQFLAPPPIGVLAQSEGGGRVAPYTVAEKFGSSAVAGYQRLKGDVDRFGAIYNLITGDEQAAERRLNSAKMYDDLAADMLSGFESFEQFLDTPTVGGFFDQVVKAVGEFTPMAISSIASGFTGAAVQAVGKGVLSATSRKLTREVVEEVLKKQSLSMRNLGPPLDASDRAILDGAYGLARKAYGRKNVSAGEALRAGSRGPGLPLTYGMWAGAGGQEYVVGSSQALSEYEEAGYKLTSDEAAAALALGIPQALIGTLGEKLFVGALFKRATGTYAAAKLAGDAGKAAESAGWIREIAKGAGIGFLHGGTTEGITETLQEELFIQQRRAIDPTYSDREANLRRAESAFAGFFAGAARSSPTTAVASVFGKARADMARGAEGAESIARMERLDLGAGRPLVEPKAWAVAQVSALLDPATGTEAVWLPGTGLSEQEQMARAADVIKTAGAANIDPVYAANGQGILLVDRTKEGSTAILNAAIASDFSETFLKDALGYTQEQLGESSLVVQVKDKAGNVVWSQAVSDAGVEQARARARVQFPDEGNYAVETKFKADAVEERRAALDLEGFRSMEEEGEPDLVRKPLKVAEQDVLSEEQIRQRQQEQEVQFFPARDETEFANLEDEPAREMQRKRAQEEEDFVSYLEESFEETFTDEAFIRGILDQLPYNFLLRFNRVAAANPSIVYTPKAQPDGQWAIEATRTPDTPVISVGERTPRIVMEASRATQAARKTTPGWSIRDPEGKVRNVYMGTVVQYGIDLGRNEGQPFSPDVGRVVEGFNRATQALDETGHTLLYQGKPLNEVRWQQARIFNLGKGNMISYQKAQREGRMGGPTGQEMRTRLEEIRQEMAALQEQEGVEEQLQLLEAEETALEEQLEEAIAGPLEEQEQPAGEATEFEPSPVDELQDWMLPTSRLNQEATTVDPGQAGSRGTPADLSLGVNTILGQAAPTLMRILRENFGSSNNIRVVMASEVFADDFEAAGVVPYVRPPNQPSPSFRDVLRDKVTERLERPGWAGLYVPHGDGHIIVLRDPTTEEQSVKSVLTLGHELGHLLYRQELSRSLDNKDLRDRLQKAFELDKGKSSQYQRPDGGFEEWFADQTSVWLLREARQENVGAKNAVEGFFKRFAKKLNSIFLGLDSILQARFNRNAVFTDYLNGVAAAWKEGRSEAPQLSYVQEAHIRDMIDDMGRKIQKVLPKNVVQKLKRAAVDILRESKELVPGDRKHWTAEYFLYPAHNFLKKYAPGLAGQLYSPSQSETASGHINSRVRLVHGHLNGLWKLAPKKTSFFGRGEPDLDAFEATLLEAEKDVPKAELSPEAQAVRTYLEDFYNEVIRDGDPDVRFRSNFYPRILALADIRENPETQAKLAGLLAKYYTPSEVAERPPDFQKVVEALVTEDQANLEDVAGSVSEVAIGVAEERAKFFRNVPNEELRDIGALEDPGTSIRKYIEDMTKRIDYLDKVFVEVQARDIASARLEEDNPNLGFLLARDVRPGDTVRGWKAVEIQLQRIPDPRDREAARDSVKAMLGKTGLNMNPVVRNVNSVLLTMNIMSYLTFATLASLPDLAGAALRSKDFSSLKTSLGVLRHYFTNREEMNEFAREVGVVSYDSLNTMYINAAELGFMTPKAQRLSDVFFRSIGLEMYTRFTRVFALGMGEQFLIKNAKDPSDRASRYLRELQVSRTDIQHWANNGRSFSDEQGQRVKEALGRFVDESIVRPSSAERPIWASNPYTALVWQLKSFFYAYGKNIVGGAMRETRNRYSEDGVLSSAAIPLLLGATTLLPLTMVGLEIREWLKYLARGGDERAFRSDNMDFGEYSLDIVDRAGVLGPFGLALPIFQAKDFGDEFWVPPLGPTAERLEDLVKGKAKIMDIAPYAGAL